jgi:hypothetical protein
MMMTVRAFECLAATAAQWQKIELEEAAQLGYRLTAPHASRMQGEKINDSNSL